MTRFLKPEPLPKGAGIEGFRSGDEAVDAWVASHSATARSRGTAVIYVSRTIEGDVAGFYTLITHSVARGSVSGGWLKRNSPEQIPAVLLGMLGVAVEYQGLGLGASLLQDAYRNASKIAALAGARALVVDPSSARAEGFYERFGFVFIGESNRMALKL